MTLAEYRRLNGLTLEALAAKVGISKSYLCEIERGKGCSLGTALAIEAATEGAVRCSALARRAPESAQ